MCILYVSEILTNGGFGFVYPFEIWCFFDECAVGFAFFRSKAADFEQMQEVALFAVTTEIVDGDVVGTDHRFFRGFGIRDEDVVGNGKFARAGEFDESFGFHVINFFLGYLVCGIVASGSFLGLGIVGCHELGLLVAASSLVWWGYLDGEPSLTCLTSNDMIGGTSL